MLKHSPLYLFFTIFFFSACTQGKYKNIPTLTVAKKDFENSLTIDGFVEPVKMITTICPRGINGVLSYIIEDGTYVRKGDLMCVIESQNLQKDYDEELNSYEKTMAEFNILKANLTLQYALLEAQVENNDANTKIANLDSIQLLYAPHNIRRIKEIELEKAAVQKKRFDERLEALNIINDAEIKKMELRLKRKADKIESLKKRLEELFITAPIDGIVMIAVNRATGEKHIMGDPVWDRMPLVIIPELSGMRVKMWATETEYKAINVNASVIYSFDAMPENTGWGRIVIKANSGVPIKRHSNVKAYEIEASIENVLEMPMPGFTTKCRIIMKEIRDVVVIPHVAVFMEDFGKVVYVKTKRGFEMRQITTGLSSSKETIVTDALKENEVIALIKPTHSLVKKKVLLLDTDSESGDLTFETRVPKSAAPEQEPFEGLIIP